MSTYNTSDKAAAKAIATKLDNAVYYLGHGEHSRPQYTVRKVRGFAKFEIYAKYFYYTGTLHRKPNGAISTETAHHA